MVPARNLVRRHCDTYGDPFSFLDCGEDDEDNRGGSLCNDIDTSRDKNRSSSNYRSVLITAHYAMDDNVSRTPASPGAEEGEGEEEEVEEETFGGTTRSSNSKNWLQLGLGAPPSLAASTAGRARDHPLELELFTNRPKTAAASSSKNSDVDGGIVSPTVGTMPAMTLRPTPRRLSYCREDMPLPWGAVWNTRPNFMFGAASTSMLLPPSHPPSMPDLLARQFMFPLQPSTAEVVGRASGMRVIKPPPRPQSGVWFLLQAAQHQGREPSLPQIPRTYLRIKDGRMTVRMLLKYLVKKLALEDESQVKITCRGQLLLPFLTLQHVRDNIWCSVEGMALSEDSPIRDHIMTLQYSRSA